jgi:lysophospholipase
MTDKDPDAAAAEIPAMLAGTYRGPDRYRLLTAPGARLRLTSWNAPGTAGRRARGTVVILPGRAEFIEKYATETVGELLDRGFAVEAIDWRGQGLSDRPLPDRHKGHINDFATYVADLKLCLDAVLTPDSGPVIGLAHSMGGHTLLRYLAEHGRGPFAAAAMTAPMAGLKREKLLRFALMLMPERPSVDTRYLYGSGPYSRLNRVFASNMLTHDESRFRFTDRWFTADPRLAMGGPTAGWARQAIRSMTLAEQPGFLERIEIPTVIVSAGEDRLVDPATHARVVARLKQGELVTLPRSRHEVLMETDDLRAQFWDAFDRLAKRVAA